MATHHHNHHGRDADWIFDQTPYATFATVHQHDEATDLLQQALDYVDEHEHATLQQSDAFWEYLDYLGLEYGDFNWEDFREWYGND